jgi:diguanylate cyclase (GGDEF)-like protein
MDDPVEPWPFAEPGGETARLHAEVERLQARLARVERLADHDALTPLLNRRGFMRELNRALASCRRHRTDATLIYLDLDGFKGVNDRLGHAAGDAALIAVARTLEAHIRETDVAARLGGDEFAVILTYADAQAGTLKARALADAIAAIPMVWGGERVRLCASWGVRAFEADMSADQMLAEADAAMFVRKGARAR